MTAVRWLAAALALGAAAGAARAAPLEISVERAYHAWVPPLAERVSGLRLVAVVLAVRDQLGGTVGGQRVIVEGRPPALVVHLTAAGEPAHPRDPALVDQDRFGLLLLYVLPRGLERIEVQHAGRAIGQADVEPDGPRIPVAWYRVVSHAPAGPAPIDGLRRHRVLVEARDWARVSSPLGLPLRYRVTGAEQMASPDRWIEVDEQIRPIDAATGDRPLVVPLRRFVLEYWLVEGGQAPLPEARLALPPAAEAALAGAEPDLDAAHYQAE